MVVREETTGERDWSSLPNLVLSLIQSHVLGENCSFYDVCSFRAVCKAWNSIPLPK
ncbi:hypothetical protein Tsubulata_024200, partial [Turnera subulata]